MRGCGMRSSCRLPELDHDEGNQERGDLHGKQGVKSGDGSGVIRYRLCDKSWLSKCAELDGVPIPFMYDRQQARVCIPGALF
jgi:hypothetical protein